MAEVESRTQAAETNQETNSGLTAVDLGQLKEFDRSGNHGKMPVMHGTILQFPEQIEFSDPFAAAQRNEQESILGIFNDYERARRAAAGDLEDGSRTIKQIIHVEEKNKKGENEPGEKLEAAKEPEASPEKISEMTASLNRVLRAGNLAQIQDLLKQADTAGELEELAKACQRLSEDDNGLKASIRLDAETGYPVLQIESLTVNPDISCGGSERSYRLTVSEGSAEAVFNSNMGIRTIKDKVVDPDDALREIKMKMPLPFIMGLERKKLP